MQNDKTKHARVALTICSRGRPEHHDASTHVDDRERVRVAVRINTDHEVQLICKHHSDLQPKRWGTTPVPVWE